MRDDSVPEGQPVTPMSADERARIQAKHRWHTIAGPPPQGAPFPGIAASFVPRQARA